MRNFLLAFFIDPNPEAFTIPYFDISIRWYGIFFTLGFIIGYFAIEKTFLKLIESSTTLYQRDFRSKISAEDLASFNQNKVNSRSEFIPLVPYTMLSSKNLASFFADRILWFTIGGGIIGARLGHILFYDLPYYSHNPLEVFNLRAGGLASHGGALGALLAVFLYARIYAKRFPEMNFLRLLDYIVIPTALIAFFIRIGNFINQEILGSPTSMPWGVIFAHPAEGGGLISRHPVQLYEAFFYLFTYFLLKGLQNHLKEDGRLTGLFFILVFGSRFFLEYLKEPQSQVLNESFFNAGQFLSIPFVVLGLILLFKCYFINTKHSILTNK